MSARWYRLILAGEISEAATAVFGSAAVTREDGNTVVVARDQAEMLGLLQRASDLGLTVLSATEMPAPVAGSRSPG